MNLEPQQPLQDYYQKTLSYGVHAALETKPWLIRRVSSAILDLSRDGLQNPYFLG